MSPIQIGREFRDFLFKTNVFSMALGVVIGNAVTRVVDSIVKDLFMPVVGLIAPHGNWRGFHIPLRGEGKVSAGNFMGTVADFLIIAACVFVITKIFIRSQAPPPPPPSKKCPECAEQVPLEAKRCKFCTSSLLPA